MKIQRGNRVKNMVIKGEQKEIWKSRLGPSGRVETPFLYIFMFLIKNV